MATIILAAAGSAVGGAIGGGVFGISAAAIGQAVGGGVGSLIDQKIFGQNSSTINRGKVDEFRLQSATHGHPIARVFGRTRIAGQMIWSSNFKETISQSRAESGGKGGGSQVISNNYSYSISVAFALGEGIIEKIGRIWADGQEISRQDLSFVLYKGTFDQLADPVIASIEGLQNTPAFRGTAYIVFENLQLAHYGNRIPQFNFEVFRAAQTQATTGQTMREQIKAVSLIPATGEYILSTDHVNFLDNFAAVETVNVHSHSGYSDFETSVRDLTSDVPGCQSVSLVVSWFGDDLRCGSCRLRPKVEQESRDPKGFPWRVSGVNRKDASIISYIDHRPVFGGTPSDNTVIQALGHLKNIGQDIIFYPFILMDIQAANRLPDPWSGLIGQGVMPWRGRITSFGEKSMASAEVIKSEVAQFFGQAQAGDFIIDKKNIRYIGADEWSYRRFILHNAALCAAAGGVDAFCIGSEMRGLTQIRTNRTDFPAVQQLISLAREVRTILGQDTKIGYAADWSEYFGYHPNDNSGDVFFHLDSLWSDDKIDFIGIDNYMPLSDWRDSNQHLDAGYESIYNLKYLQANIEGGEGYDWHYASQQDRNRQIRTPISDGAFDEAWIFRYKDIRNWWLKRHYNRVGGQRSTHSTGWRPQSKPIWFTEVGCPTIDKGSNQPNVFIDPKSSESRPPYYSTMAMDELIQNQYITAVLKYWNDENHNPISNVYNKYMLDMRRAHVWTWDARPWPEFPGLLDVWSDGENYQLGHWITGRMFNQSLAAIVGEICETAGLYDFDVLKLYGSVLGYSIETLQTVRENLQPLMQAYDFTAVEVDGVLVFQHVSDQAVKTLTMQDLALDVDGQERFYKIRSPSLNVPGRLRLKYYDADNHYMLAQVEAIYNVDANTSVAQIEVPLVLSYHYAQNLVRKSLNKARLRQDTIQFILPPTTLSLHVGDVVKFIDTNGEKLYHINEIEENGARIINAAYIEKDPTPPIRQQVTQIAFTRPISQAPVRLAFLDIPQLSDKDHPHAPYIAATAKPFSNVAIFSAPQNNGYELNAQIKKASIFGQTLNAFKATKPNLWSRNYLHVLTSRTGLESATELTVLNGGNIFAIKLPTAQDWEIVQYQKAELQSNKSYILSNFLRGQFGTEWLIQNELPVGAEIIFLDRNLSSIPLSQNLLNVRLNYRFGPAARHVTDTSYTSTQFTARGVAYRPYAPAHLKAVNLSDKIQFSWIRRTRIGGDNWQGLDVPLGEASEQYLLEIIVANQSIRTVRIINPYYNYSNAQYIADGASPSYQVAVSQISETFGIGPKIRINVNVENQTI